MEKNKSDKFSQRTREYEESYRRYGYSPLSLSMPSDRRNIRYAELLKHCPLSLEHSITILDAGCGFGDVNGYLRSIGVSNYSYIGLDVVEGFIEEGKHRYSENANIHFQLLDFRSDDISGFHYNWAIFSQTFNYPYASEQENFENMKNSLRKIFQYCEKGGGIAFNFFNNHVDYRQPETAYFDPCEVLKFAFSLSRNVVLDNSCMPFETTVTIFKDDGFTDQVFNHFYREHEKEFSAGLFLIRKK